MHVSRAYVARLGSYFVPASAFTLVDEQRRSARCSVYEAECIELSNQWHSADLLANSRVERSGRERRAGRVPAGGVTVKALRCVRYCDTLFQRQCVLRKYSMHAVLAAAER
jgi:hypothetical protein